MENINFDKLDSLLGKLDVNKISADANEGFQELPDGYYLCEVEKTELKSTKSSGEPMVSITFKVVEDGQQTVIDEKGYSTFAPINNTKGRKVFINWVLSDESRCYKFANDMIKFEGEEPGVPLLEKEAFLTSSTLLDAIDVLTGSYIYVQISTTENKTTKEMKTWQNVVSWNRAQKLGLVAE